MARRVFTDFDAELDMRLAKRQDLTSGMRGFFLNDALKAIALEFEHPEIDARADVILTSGLDTIAAPIADLWWIEHIQDVTNDRPVEFDDKRALLRRTHQTSVSPSHYIRQKNDLVFDAKPSSNTTMRVYYVQQPAGWSAGSPILDEVFDPVIIMKAAVIGYQTVRDFAEAHVVDTEMNNYLSGWKLPRREMKKNDFRAGVKVRTR